MVGQQLPCALSGMAVPLKAHDHILRACPFMPPGQQLVTFCNRLGFLPSRGVPSRSQGLAAYCSGTLRPNSFGSGDWPVGRFAFPVAVEENLPNRKNEGKHFLAKK